MTRPEVVLVAAVARNGVIGRDNDLPWRLPEDLRRFKALTMGKVLVMGRRTFESIGRALPGRRTVVITRDPDWSAPDVRTVGSLAHALAVAGSDAEVIVAGGGQVYADALPGADRLEITHVDTDVPDGDTFFPPIDPAVWTVVEEHPADGYRFVTYRRS
jgi:dihydrofolate reductase